MFASRYHTHRFMIILFSTSTVMCFHAVVAAPGPASAFELRASAQPQPAEGDTGQPQPVDQDELRRRRLPEPPGAIPEPTVVLAPGEMPQIDFETPEINFGRVMAGYVVRHDFWFKNVGTGPLEVLRVKPTCDCTAAGDYDRIVQPGERGKISIQVDTKNLVGEVTKSVVVNTNMVSDARVVLNFKGQVWRPLESTPTKAAFGRIRKDVLESKPPTLKITLDNKMDSPARLSNVRSGNPAFSATVKVLEKGKKFELDVTAHASADPGLNHTLIDIDTSLPEMPVLRIPVSMYVTAAVLVSPPTLALPQNRPQDVRRSFFITNSTTTPMTVGEPQVSNPMLKATLKVTRPESAYRLLLVVPAAYKVPPGGDTITLKTSHPSSPTLTIPIVASEAAAR